jgi:DNA-binding GntR family transcriptional regulator
MTFVQQHDGAIEPTVNAQVFRQIRIDIVTCRLMPNERLRVESLRKRYGVGGSPIREALMRLEAEGLVILEQNKGFRVSPASREHLLDLMKTRVEIEGLALRWSIENGGVDWEANLLAAFTGCRIRKRRCAEPEMRSISSGSENTVIFTARSRPRADRNI